MENKDLETTEESAMDFILYLIKDDLPSAVVRDIHKLLDEIEGVKYHFDFKAFILIEFESKRECKAAKANGFQYTHNGQVFNTKFATITRVMAYNADKVAPNVGNGF